MESVLRYYIIAGEASGDLHGSALMSGLFRADATCEIRFWGGDRMASAGGTLVRHYGGTAVMGFTEVLGKAGSILSNLRFCRKDILSWNPDAVILIDYPGFNLRIARFAKSHGFKVFYYIPPKVWARGHRRISLLDRNTDRVFSIFPFEYDYLSQRKVKVTYAGNPLVDMVDNHGYSPVLGGAPTIALLPGSRRAELKFLMPRFAELERLVRSDSRFDGYQLVIAASPSMKTGDYLSYLPSGTSVKVIEGRTYDILRQADAAVVCSGTASLEAALIGTPQVVCYGFSALTYALARILVSGIKYISLANLITDRLLFKELIQNEASPQAIFSCLAELLPGSGFREEMLSGYRELRARLGEGGAADRVAAAIVAETKN